MCKKCDSAGLRPFPEIDPNAVLIPPISDEDRARMAEAIRHNCAFLAGVGIAERLLKSAATMQLMGDYHAAAALQAAAIVVNHMVSLQAAGRTVVELNDAYQLAMSIGSKFGASVILPDGSIVPAEAVPPPG